MNPTANGDGVGYVIESKHSNFQIGDMVCGYLEWADYSAVKFPTSYREECDG